MSEIRPRWKIINDVGYKVISRNDDGSPRKVWRCFLKEGDYGKFISIEQHWVQSMEGKKIVESNWARKSYSFPYDKKKAFGMWNSIKDLVEEAFEAEELVEEVEEEFSEELE
jgi:hypothetical protein